MLLCDTRFPVCDFMHRFHVTTGTAVVVSDFLFLGIFAHIPYRYAVSDIYIPHKIFYDI